MSIKSEIARINTEVATQSNLIAALIEQANNLPDASEGGGGTPPVIEPLNVTENGTYTPPEDVDGYSPVTVAVPAREPVLQELTITENGEYTPGEGVDGFSKVTANIAASEGGGTDALAIALLEVSAIGHIELPEGLVNLKLKLQDYSITGVTFPTTLEGIGAAAFRYANIDGHLVFPPKLKTIGSQAFYTNWRIDSVTFRGTAESIASDAFYGTTQLKTINVPWAEGAVSGAPWGATNATINYNYVED